MVAFDWNDKDLIGKRDNATGEVRPSILIIVDFNYHESVGAESPLERWRETQKYCQGCAFFFLALQLIRIIELSFQ